MRSYADFNSRETNESTIYSKPEGTPVRSKTASALETIRQYLSKVFLGNLEVRVRQVYDRFGNVHWQVYDPVTGHKGTISSEAEARAWLEQRYYL